MSSKAEAGRAEIALSGLEVAVLAEELNARLSGSYVSNIYTLVIGQLLRLKKGDTQHNVVLSPRRGAWISERVDSHEVTTEFTTSLRSGLLRSKLESVTQMGFDRIIVFSFLRGGERVELVFEIVPPGNIILLDQTRKVTLALEEIRGPHRRVVRGEKYNPPPETRLLPTEVTEERLLDVLKRDSKVGRALGRGLALPRKYIDEVLARASMHHEEPSPPPAEKVRELRLAMESLLAEARRHTLYLASGTAGHELLVVKPTNMNVLKTAQEINGLLDEFFEASMTLKATEPTDTERRVKELEATIEGLRKELTDIEARTALVKELATRVQLLPIGETTALLNEKLSKFTPSLQAQLKECNSSAAIASGLFDFAKQQQADAARIRAVVKTMEARKEREVKRAVQETKPLPQIRAKREWYEKFRWFYTSEGKLALGGRDAQSNTMLIRRYLEEGDVIYHADLFGSPFFVLKDGSAQTEEEVREVAGATVSFSSAWKTGLSSADAYWVLPDQIGTAAPTGEYLARGSFTIKGKKNFANRNLVQISIGIDSNGRIISGPEEAVAKNAIQYLTLIPHREKSSDTAKKILVELRRMAPEDVRFPFTVDDVMRMMPSGGGRIARKRAGKT